MMRRKGGERLRLHLDTAPVLEKMRAGGECPLCALKKANEADYVDSFLGGSVMEVSTRLEVNQKGFCARHLNMLFDQNNRLGLALMESSHLKEVLEKLKNRSTPKRRLIFIREAPAPGSGGPGGGASGDGPVSSCVLCDRLENTMRRYALTVAALWKTEAEFKPLLTGGKGFCLPHYEMVRQEASGALSGAALQEFLDALDEVETQNLERLVREVDWFAQKHDYRNQDKPWGESRDAVERCMKKLRGE
jgi:hypothetical protein